MWKKTNAHVVDIFLYYKKLDNLYFVYSLSSIRLQFFFNIFSSIPRADVRATLLHTHTSQCQTCYRSQQSQYQHCHLPNLKQLLKSTESLLRISRGETRFNWNPGHGQKVILCSYTVIQLCWKHWSLDSVWHQSLSFRFVFRLMVVVLPYHML